jgi:predicted nucleic acid-binding protein
MSGERWFFDTNILVYVFDANAPDKQTAARRLWERACREAIPVLSAQVLQEFLVTVTKGVNQGLPMASAREAALGFAAMAEVVTATVPLIVAATQRVEASGFSFWDALIVESALDCGASILWTEDLQDGQTIGNVVVVNPFTAPVE